jgi:hypothetical protein
MTCSRMRWRWEPNTTLALLFPVQHQASRTPASPHVPASPGHPSFYPTACARQPCMRKARRHAWLALAHAAGRRVRAPLACSA